ncbi:MAG: metalloregulator ArsR/SmtB family transcription factor [Pseudobdellovibrionaceae bacterium]
MEVEFLESNTAEVARVLKALSNHRRLQVLCAIYRNEKSVGELEQIVGISQSALSQHLAKLREDKLVETRREAQTIFYRISNCAIKDMMKSINAVYSQDDKEAA